MSSVTAPVQPPRFPMKSALVVLVLLIASLASAGTIADFEATFHDETLRIDYFHAGDSDSEEISLDMVYRQGTWAGSRTRLTDDLNLGRYYIYLYDAETGDMLYSRGFDSYFGEYQTTGVAATGAWRTYHETALVPCPKKPCDFAFTVRMGDQSLREIYRVRIDPEHYSIRREPLDDQAVIVTAHEGGDPHNRVDVVILGEGYTADQTAKFEKDVNHFAAVMLGHEPYKSLADQFNIRGVMTPSQDPGCDEPSRGVFAHTPLGTTFDSLGSERYLLTEDNRALRDLAAHVPYDALYVMVNHERYGGGGIYNAFNTFTSDNQWSDYVFLHEFGHHFAGLADEYYTSQTAYNDFYPRGIEPLERNITRLIDPSRCKWQDLVSGDAELPTPWAKAEYDKADIEYQKTRGATNDRVAELMTSGASTEEVEAAKAEGEELSRSHQAAVDARFAGSPFKTTVGAFEGAGYTSEGMYRSQLDCIMFTKGIKPFCAACNAAIIEVIERYGE